MCISFNDDLDGFRFTFDFISDPKSKFLSYFHKSARAFAFFLLNAFGYSFLQHHIKSDAVDSHRVGPGQQGIVPADKLRIGGRAAVETSDNRVDNIQYNLVA